MKGKGIQVTNKAYRDGHERTFKKPTLLEKMRTATDELERNSEIPSLLDSLRDVNSYTKEELNKHFHLADFVALRDGEWTEEKVYAITNEEITDPGSWVKARFIEKTEVCVENIDTKPLMESWVLDINHFEGLD